MSDVWTYYLRAETADELMTGLSALGYGAETDEGEIRIRPDFVGPAWPERTPSGDVVDPDTGIAYPTFTETGRILCNIYRPDEDTDLAAHDLVIGVRAPSGDLVQGEEPQNPEVVAA